MSPRLRISRLPTPVVTHGATLLLLLMTGVALIVLPSAAAKEEQGSTGLHHPNNGSPPTHGTGLTYGSLNRNRAACVGSCPARGRAYTGGSKRAYAGPGSIE